MRAPEGWGRHAFTFPDFRQPNPMVEVRGHVRLRLPALRRNRFFYDAQSRTPVRVRVNPEIRAAGRQAVQAAALSPRARPMAPAGSMADHVGVSPTAGPLALQPMRFDGLLVEWSDAYGCGLIQANQGGDPLVVEASAFVDGAGRPRQGQALSFEIRLSETGHKEAVEVRRARADTPWGPGAARPARPAPMSPPDQGPGLLRRMLGVAALAAAGFAGVQAWHSDAGAGMGLGLGANETTEQAQAGRAAEAAIAEMQRGRVAPAAAPESPSTLGSPAEAAAARCDGRTFCSQMNSCAEARWFLQNCPGTEMDGDHDGIPCEQQWCSAN